MAYRIERVTLSSRRHTSTGPAGLVFDREDIADFITDYMDGHHSCDYMLLSVDLSREFEAHHDEFIAKLKYAATGLFGAVAAGSGGGILSNIGKIMWNGPLKNFSSDPFDRIQVICAWKKKSHVKFECGRIGVSL